MNEYDLEIEDAGVSINGVLIDEIIFQEEKIDYTPREREEQINDLIDWISETKRDGDRRLMKEDLKYLMNLGDMYVFSSIITNEFIAKSDNEEEFNTICKSILELNNKLNVGMVV